MPKIIHIETVRAERAAQEAAEEAERPCVRQMLGLAQQAVEVLALAIIVADSTDADRLRELSGLSGDITMLLKRASDAAR